ncbi:hypothetical protein LWI29_001017 [Acer saccharum]|uniref:Uncharacterized protein n=1 Tax=Acer saccharum TaxID=4024 RepID=A0AA39S2B6_ACESA|nr:hypothetical protein LWI29_001017 [Acer saccharum]
MEHESLRNGASPKASEIEHESLRNGARKPPKWSMKVSEMEHESLHPHGSAERLRIGALYKKPIEEMCNHSSSDSDPQEEYSPLSVEEYLPQPVEDHSVSSDDFDPQKENSQLPVEEFLPSLVEDDSSPI